MTSGAPLSCSTRLSRLLAVCVLAAACARPIDRPLSGAPPPGADHTPLPVARAEPPPTLGPPTSLPFNPDRHEPRASTRTPTPNPAERPLVRGIQPAPNARVPLGEVEVIAHVQGFSNLVQVTATLNGMPVIVEVGGRDERNWTAFFAEKLEPGEHEVRMVAQDDRGRTGSAVWRFTVLAEPATPRPSPTRAPTPPLGPPAATRTPRPTFTPTSTPTRPVTRTTTPTPRPSATPTAAATPTARPQPSPTATLAAKGPAASPTPRR